MIDSSYFWLAVIIIVCFTIILMGTIIKIDRDEYKEDKKKMKKLKRE